MAAAVDEGLQPAYTPPHIENPVILLPRWDASSTQAASSILALTTALVDEVCLKVSYCCSRTPQPRRSILMLRTYSHVQLHSRPSCKRLSIKLGGHAQPSDSVVLCSLTTTNLKDCPPASINNHQTQPGGLDWHFTCASFRSCRVCAPYEW